jgi:hypothetical protein
LTLLMKQDLVELSRVAQEGTRISGERWRRFLPPRADAASSAITS